VTAEVTPHHLLLPDEWGAGRRRFVGETTVGSGPSPDPAAKVNPPLRPEPDARALLDGLRDGTFDIVATDHAPHAAEDKPADLAAAAFGMIGLEVAFPLMLRLARDGRLSLPLLVDA
jgi:dihydroorotase